MTAFLLVLIAIGAACALYETLTWPSVEEQARARLTRDLSAWDADLRADFRRSMRRHA